MPTKKPSAQKVSRQLREQREKPSPPVAGRAEVPTPEALSPGHPREPRRAEAAPVKPEGTVPTKEPKLIADLPPHDKLAWEGLEEEGFRLPSEGATVIGNDAWIECRPPADTRANYHLADRASQVLRRVGLNVAPEHI